MSKRKNPKEGKIVIISGEGTYGSAEEYTGKNTPLAIKRRLTKERSHGDRWARAVQFSHESPDGGLVGINLESGEYCTFPDDEYND